LKDVVIADINAAMGSIFRSEEVTLAQLFLQSEAAYATVRELGELGRVQFRDLNPEVSAFQRKYINEVRRCDDMERRLRFLAAQLDKAGIEARPAGNVEAPDPQTMIDLESRFEALEVELKEINTNKETLRRNLLDLIELQHILKKTQVFFQEAEAQSMRPGRERRLRARDTESDRRGLLADSDPEAGGGGGQAKFTFVTGVIAREKIPAFERILWRACRGNVFLRQTAIDHPLDDPATGDQVYKVVFILFFQGDQLRTRVRKICEGFRATLYQCPETSGEREQMTVAVSNRIRDLESVLHTTEEHSFTQLQEVAVDIDAWQTKVRKMKAIYHAMNMFNIDVTQRCLIAECWCPVKDIPAVQGALARGTVSDSCTSLTDLVSHSLPPGARRCHCALHPQ
jgi:V-type H+-transporting ATPase subunit a